MRDANSRVVIFGRSGRFCVQLIIYQAQDRYEFGLLVEFELIVHCAVQVNCESGNTDQRAVNLDEARRECSIAVRYNNAPGNGEIPIKPGVPNSSPIDFARDLKIAGL